MESVKPSELLSPCVCGSNKHYQDCCNQYISGNRPAVTVEALMRSRFTAYTQLNFPYLKQTWHPRTRREKINVRADIKWLDLEVVNVNDGGEFDKKGTVEFIVNYQIDQEPKRLHEISLFRKEKGRWYYYNGKYPQPKSSQETPRNSPCSCGSGNKFKRCCGK